MPTLQELENLSAQIRAEVAGMDQQRRELMKRLAGVRKEISQAKQEAKRVTKPSPFDIADLHRKIRHTRAVAAKALLERGATKVEVMKVLGLSRQALETSLSRHEWDEALLARQKESSLSSK